MEVIAPDGASSSAVGHRHCLPSSCDHRQRRHHDLAIATSTSWWRRIPVSRSVGPHCDGLFAEFTGIPAHRCHSAATPLPIAARFWRKLRRCCLEIRYASAAQAAATAPASETDILAPETSWFATHSPKRLRPDLADGQHQPPAVLTH